MDRTLALVVTLFVGGLVALQPPANALLARRAGDLGAAFTSLVISTLIVGLVLVVSGRLGDLSGLASFRPVHVIGGIAGAAIVAVSLVTVRPLGAATLTAALVTTQLIVSAIIDRSGWLGLTPSPLSATRLAGIALLIVGTVLVTSR